LRVRFKQFDLTFQGSRAKRNIIVVKKRNVFSEQTSRPRLRAPAHALRSTRNVLIPVNSLQSGQSRQVKHHDDDHFDVGSQQRRTFDSAAQQVWTIYAL